MNSVLRLVSLSVEIPEKMKFSTVNKRRTICL